MNRINGNEKNERKDNEFGNEKQNENGPQEYKSPL